MAYFPSDQELKERYRPLYANKDLNKVCSFSKSGGNIGNVQGDSFNEEDCLKEFKKELPKTSHLIKGLKSSIDSNF